MFSRNIREYSSIGRASILHVGGYRFKSDYFQFLLFDDIAQSVEHWNHTPSVAGSIPVIIFRNMA
jgi:hypothetical protein